MKSKIKQITLTDGKQLFYPSEEEVRKLTDQIESFIVEETMTKEEYLNYCAQMNIIADATVLGLGIGVINYKEYY